MAKKKKEDVGELIKEISTKLENLESLPKKLNK